MIEHTNLPQILAKYLLFLAFCARKPLFIELNHIFSQAILHLFYHTFFIHSIYISHSFAVHNSLYKR